MIDLKENPFSVTTPDRMTASQVKELFVQVFTDYPKVYRDGHLFLHGPRGSGKSMIFRYLLPDCQMLEKSVAFNELTFFSVYIPLRNTDLKLTEFKRLKDHPAGPILNEHFMVLFIAERIFSSLEQMNLNFNSDQIKELNSFYELFQKQLQDFGWSPTVDDQKADNVFKGIKENILKLYRQVIKYLRDISFSQDIKPFEGPLCSYMDFLYPTITELMRLSFMPRGSVYLLIDDADNLNLTQTKILNTWVSTRSISSISLKISTQLSYKTYRTLFGNTIDSIHDYSEINISTIYTSTKDSYKDRVKEIIQKRLKIASLPEDPYSFFIEDEVQEKKIKEIGDTIRQDWDKKGRGNRAIDDVQRYARPDYMKTLAGNSKSSYTYNYAGFEQLIHISSGVIRYFLEAAAIMYNEVKSREPETTILFIPCNIQDKVVRKLSDEFLMNELEKYFEDKDENNFPISLLKKLSNLIECLGGTFREILLSDRSERRVFSVAISDDPTDEVIEVLKIGIKLGYFHLSSIGNKMGTGRTRLYILNRRLAPHFNLDPTGFAGYLFLKNELLLQAIQNPKKLLYKIKNYGVDEIIDGTQLELFQEEAKE